MRKESDISREKALLKGLEDLIDSKDAGQKYANSFLGFCSRLLSIRPKADTDFRLSLQQDLLKKHPAYLEKKVNAPLFNKFNMLKSMMRGLSAITGGELPTRTRVRRFAFGSVPALAIVLALIIAIGNPQVDIARAMEILADDPQISAVIEEYDLKVQGVEVRDNVAYIFLDLDPDKGDLEVTITVDLDDGTIGKTIAEEGEIIQDEEVVGTVGELTAKKEGVVLDVPDIKAYFDKKKACFRKMKIAFAAKAERMGMSPAEYKAHLAKEESAAFTAKAEEIGMTPKEYKAYLVEEKIVKVKPYLEKMKEAFAAKAERMGMTPEEYKAYLAEEWNKEPGGG